GHLGWHDASTRRSRGRLRHMSTPSTGQPPGVVSLIRTEERAPLRPPAQRTDSPDGPDSGEGPGGPQLPAGPPEHDLAVLTLSELRTLRRDAQREEADLSYVRRLLQGRIDILRAELARRSPAG